MFTKKLLSIIVIGILASKMLVAMESTGKHEQKLGAYMPTDARKINETEYAFNCSTLGEHEFPILSLKTLIQNDKLCVVFGAQDRVGIFDWETKTQSYLFAVSDKNSQQLRALDAIRLPVGGIRSGFVFYEAGYTDSLEYIDQGSGGSIARSEDSGKGVIMQTFLNKTDSIAIAYDDGRVGIMCYGDENPFPPKIIGKHDAEITCLVNLGHISCSGPTYNCLSTLASASKDGVIKLWDCITGSILETIEVGHEIVSLLRFSENYLAITFKNSSTAALAGKIWDMQLNRWKYYWDHKPDGYYNFTSYGPMIKFYDAIMLVNNAECSSFGAYDDGESLTAWHTADGKQINLYASTDGTNNPNKNIKVTHMTMINDHLVFVGDEPEANGEYKIYYSNEPFVFIKNDNP